MNDKQDEEDKDKPMLVYFGKGSSDTDFMDFIQAMKVMIAAGYFNKPGESNAQEKIDEL